MPSYNSEKYISQAIESVLSQTYKIWELIIVDDCSSDNSVKIVESYCERDNRIKLIKLNSRTGPANARNIGIERAQGRYISFLDADDLWLPDKLEKQIIFMQENNLAFTYCSYYLIDENGNYLDEFIVEHTINYKSMLKKCSVSTITAIYDVERIGKVYMPNIPIGEDYALWLRILKKIKLAKGIITPLACCRLLKKSASSNKFRVAKYRWRVYREFEQLSFFKSCYYFVHYAYNGFVKYGKLIKRYV